jgi:hypothetical protein
MACFLVAASVAGFWLVNYPWGKLFMGDGGAYFSGFALAWFAVLLPVRNPEVSVWAGLLVCAYPVIEVIYSIVRRARRHQSPGAPDSGHLHSLIKVKLIRSRAGSAGVDKSVRNAAVSPIVWTFSTAPAVMATSLFDRPALLASGILVCVAAYHAFYRYLAGKRSLDEAVGQFSATVEHSSLKHTRGHLTSRRHRARGRRSGVAR